MLSGRVCATERNTSLWRTSVHIASPRGSACRGQGSRVRGRVRSGSTPRAMRTHAPSEHVCPMTGSPRTNPCRAAFRPWNRMGSAQVAALVRRTRHHLMVGNGWHLALGECRGRVIGALVVSDVSRSTSGGPLPRGMFACQVARGRASAMQRRGSVASAPQWPRYLAPCQCQWLFSSAYMAGAMLPGPWISVGSPGQVRNMKVACVLVASWSSSAPRSLAEGGQFRPLL